MKKPVQLPIIKNIVCSIMLEVWRSDGVMGGHGWFEVGAGSAADADPVSYKQMTWTLRGTFAVMYGTSGQFVQT